LPGFSGVVKRATRLAPARADVDEQRVLRCDRLCELARDDRLDRATARRIDELQLARVRFGAACNEREQKSGAHVLRYFT
jgi:hypothetical protein